MAWGTRSYVSLGLRPKWVLGSRPRSYVIIAGTAISVLIVLLLMLRLGGARTHLFSSPKSASMPTFALSAVSPHVCINASEGVPVGRNVIPNQVHYIWLLKDPALFQLEFKHFVSFYSTHLYLEPNLIYIHTDAAPDVFAHAKKSGNDWTRRILSLAYVQYNHVTVPTQTRNGVEIKNPKHQAEFLSIEILHHFGGVYLDPTAIPLRAMTDLRYSGFANIVGSRAAAATSTVVDNGVMLSVPGSTLMDIYLQGAHEHFNSKTAASISTALLTDISRRLASVPHEVLILSSSAFAPLRRSPHEQAALFQPHDAAPAASRPALWDAELDTCREVFGWVEANEAYGGEEWEVDFAGAYVARAFYEEVEGGGVRGWDGGVDLQYVLARRSNYARMVYPAVARAIGEGVIPEGEALGNGWQGV